MTNGRSLVVKLQALRYAWPGGFTLALPELYLEQGETLLLLGESGAGKSTLLSLICGTLFPQQGQIEICGTLLSQLRPAARDRFRAEHIGVIFQQFNLLPFANVLENILLPLHFAPARRARLDDPEATARALCAQLKLPADILKAKAETLSVGQQQRVAVARALIGAPPLVVADEPTSALDKANQTAFLDLLFAQLAETHAALLMVSHDESLARRFDRTLRLEEIAA